MPGGATGTGVALAGRGTGGAGDGTVGAESTDGGAPGAEGLGGGEIDPGAAEGSALGGAGVAVASAEAGALAAVLALVEEADCAAALPLGRLAWAEGLAEPPALQPASSSSANAAPIHLRSGSLIDGERAPAGPCRWPIRLSRSGLCALMPSQHYQPTAEPGR